jgi:alkanesulfonate monooxygenase SsuD/methylene tetrahydromethanopterin reductase-like flavin-dependent oxidoreductase (luciferase family)
MDFSALIFPNGRWADVVDRARRAEELGFRGLWVDDHIVNPARPAQRWYNAWTTLAGLAAATSRIRLGPLVSNVVLRHPVLLARQALSVEAMSGGRLQLGIGAGYAPTDHAAVDVPVWARAERSARFRDAVERLDQLLRGATDTLGLRPTPERRLPLCVAAHTSSSLRLAAEYGDLWSSFGGSGWRPRRSWS